MSSVRGFLDASCAVGGLLRDLSGQHNKTAVRCVVGAGHQGQKPVSEHRLHAGVVLGFALEIGHGVGELGLGFIVCELIKFEDLRIYGVMYSGYSFVPSFYHAAVPNGLAGVLGEVGGCCIYGSLCIAIPSSYRHEEEP